MSSAADAFDPAAAVDVSLGMLMDGHVRVWKDDAPQLWKVPNREEFDEVSEFLGSGAISTDQYEVAHSRERASLDMTSSVLCVGVTTSFSHRDSGTVGRGIFIELRPEDRRKRNHGSWIDVEEVIVRASAGARARGEILVVGPGPYPHADGPSVLIGTSTVNAWVYSVISAKPGPATGSWTGNDGADARSTLLATMSDTARYEAAELTATALQEWGVAPFDVGIGFIAPIELLTRPVPNLRAVDE